MLETKKYSITSKDKRRGRYREKRLSKFEPNWLTTDAPIGKYLVDGVAQELFASDTTAASTDSSIKLVKRMREEVNRAVEFAIASAKNHYFRGPGKLHETKSFFDDLREIQSLIQQHNNLNSFDIFLSTKPGLTLDLAGPLRAALQNADSLIQECLERHKPVGEGGNNDWLTQEFIQRIFDLWCNYLRVEIFSDEPQFFVRLIEAAWLDVGLPSGEEDDDGRCLKEWLAERLRNQFPAGVPRARADMQASAYWKGMLRAGWYRNFPFHGRRDLPAEKL